MDCYSKWKTQYKVCVVCGEAFADPQSNPTVTCGPDCSKAHRQDLYAKGVNTAALEKAHEVSPTRPLTGPFVTNINARDWVIQSPDGRIYECRNLMLWLRDHADLLDGTVKQAWDGISKIKYSMQGKRKNLSHQWKGWRLISGGKSE